MSEFVEVKTDELVGPALDWATAKCSGMPFFTMGEDWPGNYNVTVLADEAPILILDIVNRMWREHQGVTEPWSPSTNWAQGGPLLETCNWALPYRASSRQHIGKFESCTPGGFPHNGNTPLIAACRAIVAAQLGDVVQAPAVLVGMTA